jgi:hypothetical protein
MGFEGYPCATVASIGNTAAIAAVNANSLKGFMAPSLSF